jgi:hypothetical protein
MLRFPRLGFRWFAVGNRTRNNQHIRLTGLPPRRISVAVSAGKNAEMDVPASFAFARFISLFMRWIQRDDWWVRTDGNANHGKID